VGGQIAALQHGEGVDVGLGRDVLPGDRWQMRHHRPSLLDPEHLLELAVQRQPGAVVGRHVVSPSVRRINDACR